MNHKEYLEGLIAKLNHGIVHKPTCENAAEVLRVMVKLIDAVKFAQEHTTDFQTKTQCDSAIAALDEWRKEDE